jgi:la-related protein 1
MGPPPVEDAVSWPTPETAQDEEKRRAQEKGPKAEKEKVPALNARPQGKEKWVHVPYTPTAVFNTPLPPAKRGGRQSRGGRENGGRGGGHTSNGSVGGERGSNPQNPTAGSTTENAERGRHESGNIRATSLPPKSTKRSTSAGGSNVRDQRKFTAPPTPDRRREEDSISERDDETRGAAYHDGSSRRTSIATQTDSRNRLRQDNRPGRFDGTAGTSQPLNIPESLERGQHSGPESHSHPKSAGPDRRRESFVSNSDYGRDTAQASQASQSSTRGGVDRGRGGRHRGRGGHNAPAHQYATQQISNGHAFQQPQTAPFSPTKSMTFSYGQSHQQAAQGSQYGGSQRTSRNYRDQPRAQSIPNSAVYGSFPHGPYGGPQQIAPLQTALPPYDYPVHPASAGSYAYTEAYTEPVPLIHLVTLQL